MRRTRPAVLLLAAVLGCGGPADRPAAQTSAAGVTLAEVSVAGLEAAVAEQKGKVVLLDVWFLG